MKRVQVAIAIIVRDGKILICQRLPEAPLGGLWEFPGGKVEPGETIEQCLQREAEEEVNLRIRPRQRLPQIDYDYPNASVRLHPFLCDVESGQVECRGCQAARWVNAVQLRDYSFPPANAGLTEQLISLLNAEASSQNRTTGACTDPRRAC